MKRSMETPKITIEIREGYNEDTRQTERFPLIEARTSIVELGSLLLTHVDDLRLLRDEIDRVLVQEQTK